MRHAGLLTWQIPVALFLVYGAQYYGIIITPVSKMEHGYASFNATNLWASALVFVWSTGIILNRHTLVGICRFIGLILMIPLLWFAAPVFWNQIFFETHKLAHADIERFPSLGPEGNAVLQTAALLGAAGFVLIVVSRRRGHGGEQQ